MLLAYAKMTLYEDVLRTELPDRAYFVPTSPSISRARCGAAMPSAIEQHRLRREIAATWIANSVVNRGLAVFVSELEDETGASLEDVLLAYVTARDSFGLLRVVGRDRGVAGQRSGRAADAPARGRRATCAVRGTRWFITQGDRPFRMRDAVARFRPGIETVMGSLDAVIGPRHAAEIDAARAEYEAPAWTRTVARQIAGLPQLLAACDIVRTAPAGGGEAGLLEAARVYFALDGALDLPWLQGRQCGRRRGAGAGIGWP